MVDKLAVFGAFWCAGGGVGVIERDLSWHVRAMGRRCVSAWLEVGRVK
jgi:hypothetical protein